MLSVSTAGIWPPAVVDETGVLLALAGDVLVHEQADVLPGLVAVVPVFFGVTLVAG